MHALRKCYGETGIGDKGQPELTRRYAEVRAAHSTAVVGEVPSERSAGWRNGDLPVNMVQLKETMDLLREIENRKTKFSCIKRIARENPEAEFTSLAHYLTEEFLTASFRELKKSAASGIDGKSARDYETNLQENIKDLQTRLRNKSYKAPNIRRAWIDKGGGKKRPLGISTVEDKIVQRAISNIFNLIYEQDFYDISRTDSDSKEVPTMP